MILAFSACSRNAEVGEMQIHIGYHVDNQELIIDTLAYVNEAGNPYLVDEIQWFISDIELIDSQHNRVAFNKEQNIFYVDSNLPDTQTINATNVPAGCYQSIHFTFGLNEVENQSWRFVNPPESDMFWPEQMGGGYHHIKLNGKWQDTEGEIVPFCMHIGKGPADDATGFRSNYFEVEIPANFTIGHNALTSICLNMNINNWFCQPNTYDFNEWGGAIMQNQAAQETLKENGHNVFSIFLPQAEF